MAASDRRLARLILLLILLAGFAVRAVSFYLPGLPEPERGFYRDETGAPYLTEMDSYYYARLAQEMAESGQIFLLHDRGTDPLMESRIQEPAAIPNPALLSALACAVWQALAWLFPVSLMQVIRWLPPLLASLAAIPAFRYAYRRTNLTGGAVAALLTAFSVSFVSHTFPGVFDTDCLLALLPLMLMLQALKALQAEDLKAQVLYALSAGLCMGLLSLTWLSYPAYFWLMAACGGLAALLSLLAGRKSSSRFIPMRGLGFTIAASLLILFCFRGLEGITDLVSVVLSLARTITGIDSVYPNAFRFTGEMLAPVVLPDLRVEGPFSLIYSATDTLLMKLGGIIPCLLALSAFPLMLRKLRRTDGGFSLERSALWTEVGFFAPWLLAGILLAARYQRFSEIASLPLAMLAGLAAGHFSGQIRWKRRIRKHLLSGILLLCAILPSLCVSAQTAWNAVPSATDLNQQSMAWVRETRSENAVLMSWWDDGYFSQFTARRRTPPDGGTSSGSYQYFLAKALLTDDPQTSIGILRMLESASLRPLDQLKRAGLPEVEAASLLLSLAPLSRDAAESRLQSKASLSEDNRESILAMTHPQEERPLLLVLGNDLLARIRAIAYYGFWDLNKGRPDDGAGLLCANETVSALKPGETCTFTLSSAAIPLHLQMEADGLSLLPCGSTFDGWSSLSYWRDGVLQSEITSERRGYAVILIEEAGEATAFACTPNLKDSMLVRLYICRDQQLDGFSLLQSWTAPADAASPLERRVRAEAEASCVQIWHLDE